MRVILEKLQASYCVNAKSAVVNGKTTKLRQMPMVQEDDVLPLVQCNPIIPEV